MFLTNYGGYNANVVWLVREDNKLVNVIVKTTNKNIRFFKLCGNSHVRMNFRYTSN